MISFKVYQGACTKAGYCIDSLFAVRGPKSCLYRSFYIVFYTDNFYKYTTRLKMNYKI